MGMRRPTRELTCSCHCGACESAKHTGLAPHCGGTACGLPVKAEHPCTCRHERGEHTELGCMDCGCERPFGE